MLSFSDQSVLNNSAGPPNFVSASTNAAGTTVTVTFSKEMYNPSSEYQQFSVTTSTGNNKFPASATLNPDPTKIDIGLMIPSGYGEILSLSYTKGQLQGADGSYVLTFSNKSITNNVPSSTHQSWNGYADSPVLTSLYPYQAIGSRSGGQSDVLIMSASLIKWNMGFLSSSSGLFYSESAGGSWQYFKTGIESQSVSITQCNNNIYALDGVTVVYYKTI